MSSFNCEKCGTAILDSPGGQYTTECEHYPKFKKTPISAPCRCGIQSPCCGISKGLAHCTHVDEVEMLLSQSSQIAFSTTKKVYGPPTGKENLLLYGKDHMLSEHFLLDAGMTVYRAGDCEKCIAPMLRFVCNREHND